MEMWTYFLYSGMWDEDACGHLKVQTYWEIDRWLKEEETLQSPHIHMPVAIALLGGITKASDT